MVTPRRILISLLAAVAVVGIGWAFTSSQPDEQVRFVQGVERLFPATGDLDVRQAQIGADLEAGLTGVIQVDGIEIPEDQLQRVPATGLVLYSPGPGTETGRLDPGRHCAKVVYWKAATQTRADARQHTWCFTVH